MNGQRHRQIVYPTGIKRNSGLFAASTAMHIVAPPETVLVLDDVKTVEDLRLDAGQRATWQDARKQDFRDTVEEPDIHAVVTGLRARLQAIDSQA